MRVRYSLSLIGLALVVLTSCRGDNAGPEVGYELGKDAPAIQTKDIHGNTFELKSLKGDYVLLDFWASWCGPCITEAPQLVALHNEFAPKGLQVVTIAIEKNDKNWRRAAEQLGFIWDYQIVETSQFVRFNPIASDYGVTDIPSTFLLDKEGKVIASKRSIAEIRLMLEDLL